MAIPQRPELVVTLQIVSDSGTTMLDQVIQYCYDADILNLGDPFAVTVSNADGQYSGKFHVGDRVKMFISSPTIQGGKQVPRINGIITALRYTEDMNGGSILLIEGADLGWILTNTCAPLWAQYKSGITWLALLSTIVDPEWGFTELPRDNNELNRTLSLGISAFRSQQTAALLEPLPRFFFEPGQTIGATLLSLARINRVLLNVSVDGALQVFRPATTGEALYTFERFPSHSFNRTRNNVQRAELQERLDGVYTETICVGQRPFPSPDIVDFDHPHADKIRGDFSPPEKIEGDGILRLFYPRLWTFSDYDRISDDQAEERAKWQWQRGQFDSWALTYTVEGVAQNGTYFVPDTFCTIEDDIFGIPRGLHYISSVRCSRTFQQGDVAILTIHKPGILSG